MQVFRGNILHCKANPLTHGDEAVEHIPDGLLFVKRGKVVGCGAARALYSQIPAECNVQHASDSWIVPGFIDTHLHYTQMEIMASYGEQLLTWLEKYAYPTEEKFSQDRYAEQVATLFLKEMLRQGTTSAAVFTSTHASATEILFMAAEARQMRLLAGKVLMDQRAPKALCDGDDKGKQATEELILHWNGRARLAYALTPRFAATSTKEQMQMVSQLLQRYPEVYLQTHLAENREETQWVGSLYPECQNYVDIYDRYQFLGKKSLFAHGLHLSNEEFQRIAETKSVICWCPNANLFMGSGLLDIKKIREHDIRLSLATDVGAGTSFSMFTAINEAYKVAQMQGYSLPPFYAFYLMTLAGAEALSWDDKIGNFQIGKEADFLILRPKKDPILALRMHRARDLKEKLFAMLMLGNSNIIQSTHILGHATK